MGAKLQRSHGLGESQDVTRNSTSIDPMLTWISDKVEKLGTGGWNTNITFDALTLVIAVVNFCYCWVYNILSFLSCPFVDLFVDILSLSCLLHAIIIISTTTYNNYK